MAKYELKYATEQDIKDMYDRSEWTWEGMTTDEDNLDAIAQFIELNAPKVPQPYTFWTWTGDTFNKMYDLTGNNAYPDDLIFLAVDNLYEPLYPILKMRVGARWLDDIVDNIKWREEN